MTSGDTCIAVIRGARVTTTQVSSDPCVPAPPISVGPLPFLGRGPMRSGVGELGRPRWPHKPEIVRSNRITATRPQGKMMAVVIARKLSERRPGDSVRMLDQDG